VGGGTGIIGSLRSAADGEEPALPSLGELLASVSERLARLQASTAADDAPSPTGARPRPASSAARLPRPGALPGRHGCGAAPAAGRLTP
jgi:hypothetical protein